MLDMRAYLSMHKDLGSGGFNLKNAWIIILASALLFVSIAGISMSTTPVSNINSTGSYFGSVSKGNFITMLQYMEEKNETAFNTAMTAGLSAGTIVVFNNSESVYVMDHDYSNGLIQVRPNGDKQLYWTVHEAVPGSWK